MTTPLFHLVPSASIDLKLAFTCSKTSMNLKLHFLINTDAHCTVTRSHKLNDRDHAGLADGTAAAEEHLPRYFAKSGYEGADPKKTKKNGGGKGNW